MITQLIEFIKTKHVSIYNKWIEEIPEQSKKIFSGLILSLKSVSLYLYI